MKRAYAGCLMGLFLLSAAALAEEGTVYEAEKAELAAAGAKIKTDATASGGQAVVIGHKVGRFDDAESVPPALTFKTTVPRDGMYTLSLRVRGANGGSDSCYLSLDGEKAQPVFVNQHGEWLTWDMGPLQLTAGAHEVVIKQREYGFEVDSLTVGRNRYAKSALEKFPEPSIWPVKGEHPRLLVRAGDIPMLRERLSHPENAPVWARVKELVASPVVEKLDPKVHTTVRGVFNEKVLVGIQARAFVWLLEGNRQAGEDAVRSMTGVLRTSSFTRGFQDITRQIGYTIYCASLVYDWCYALMTPELRAEYIERCEELCGQMEVGFPPLKQGNVTGHAGEAQIFRDLLGMGIAMYDECPEMYRITAGRFLGKSVEARNAFYASGRHHQGNAYGPYRYSWEIWGGWVFRRLCGKDVFEPEKVGRMVAFWLYPRLPDGTMFSDGDNYQRRAQNAGRYVTYTFAPFMCYTYAGNGLAKGEFWRQGGARWALGDPVTFLLFNDPAVKSEEPDQLPLTHYYGDPLGAMVARNGWGLGADSALVAVSMKGAGVQYNNHHHADAGSFQIYYRGLLAADLGLYGKYGTPYDWSFNKQSISHNVVRVTDPAELRLSVRQGARFHNDGGQVFPNGAGEPLDQQTLVSKGHRVGKTTAHAFGPNAQLPLYSHLKCDLSRAYGPKVKDYQRSFVYFNLDTLSCPAALVVFDRVSAANAAFAKTWNLNTYLEPTMTADGFNVVWDRDDCHGALQVVSLLPEAENRRISSGEAVTFNGRTFEPPFPQDPAATGRRTEISPLKPSATDTFLTVLAVGSADAIPAVKATLLRDGAMVGAAFAGQAACFAADGKLLTTAFTVSLAEPHTRVVVTDLAAGGWDVRRDGQLVASGIVTAEAHTLFFAAEQAGRYSVAPAAGHVTPTDYTALKARVATGDSGILVNGRRYAEATLTKDGEYPYAPVDVIGGDGFRATADGCELKVPGGTCVFREGAKSFKFNGLEVSLHRPLIKKDGNWQLPVFVLGQLLSYRTKEGPLASSVSFLPAMPAVDELPVRAASSPADGRELVSYLFDGVDGTYWAGSGKDAEVTVFLGALQAVGGVEIHWYRGTERDYRYELQVSEDGKTYVTAAAGGSAQAKISRVDLGGRQARFVRFVGNGNNQNQWSSVSGLRILK